MIFTGFAVGQPYSPPITIAEKGKCHASRIMHRAMGSAVVGGIREL